MKFCIVQMTAGATGGITYLIHDPIKMLLYSLESLGHDVIFQENNISKSHINILVTSYRMNLRQVQALKRHDVQYIVYQTEIFSEKGLNEQSSGLFHVQNVYLVWRSFFR